MAISYLQQTNANNYLIPITTSDDCPLDNTQNTNKFEE